MTTFTPLVFPSLTNPAWNRAREIIAALRVKEKKNPFVVAAVVNGFAESWWEAIAHGDNGQSHGPWQLKWQFYGEPILDALRIDIRTEPSLARHVDALLFALSIPANHFTLQGLEAAKTGSDATFIFAHEFERASAGGAVDRRVAAAPHVEVCIAEMDKQQQG